MTALERHVRIGPSAWVKGKRPTIFESLDFVNFDEVILLNLAKEGNWIVESNITVGIQKVIRACQELCRRLCRHGAIDGA
jgi:hypothetical protein